MTPQRLSASMASPRPLSRRKPSKLMARALFRQRDAAALGRAVRASGCEVARVEVTPEGKIVVIIGKPGEGDSETKEIVL